MYLYTSLLEVSKPSLSCVLVVVVHRVYLCMHTCGSAAQQQAFAEGNRPKTISGVDQKTPGSVTCGGGVPDRQVPCRTVPCRTVPYRTVPYRTVPYRTVPYRTVPYRTVPYRAVPYRNATYRIAQEFVLWFYVCFVAQRQRCPRSTYDRTVCSNETVTFDLRLNGLFQRDYCC